MKKLIILALALTGCATHSGVLQDGKDSYVVIISQGSGFSSASDLKVAAYKEADAFCKKDHKVLEIVSEKIIQEGLLSNSAEADVRFKCIDPLGVNAASSVPDTKAH